MRILLVQPPFYGFQNINSPRLYLGLAYIGAVLEKQGHEVLIINGELCFSELKASGEEGFTVNEEIYKEGLAFNHSVFDEIMRITKEFKPDVAGISFMTATTKSADFVAEKLKIYNPNLPIIAGGVHPTLVPEDPLEKKCFDYVVRGEGEDTILELIKAIENKQEVSGILGISYRKGGKIIHNENRPYIKNLNELPLPAYHLVYNAKKYGHIFNGIITSRGCPFACTYCASKVMWTRAVRFRTPENVIEEIKDRHTRLGVASFSFHDDTLTLNRDYITKLCELMRGLDFKIEWHCDTRGDTLDFKILKLMKKAGCYHIYLGLESGSPKILKLIKKNIDTKKVKKAVRMAQMAGITTTVYFMVGFPEETEEDILLSIKAMKWIGSDSVIWSILTPYPGTEIWEIGKAQGVIPERPNWDNYFHHFNQGSVFKTMPREKWDQMLELIDKEQKRHNHRLAFGRAVYLAGRVIKDPRKIIKFIIKKCCPKLLS